LTWGSCRHYGTASMSCRSPWWWYPGDETIDDAYIYHARKAAIKHCGQRTNFIFWEWLSSEGSDCSTITIIPATALQHGGAVDLSWRIQWCNWEGSMDVIVPFKFCLLIGVFQRVWCISCVSESWAVMTSRGSDAGSHVIVFHWWGGSDMSTLFSKLIPLSHVINIYDTLFLWWAAIAQTTQCIPRLVL